MFFTDDDSDRCLNCGADMAVIGPPGPQHAPNCPDAIKARQQAERERLEEENFINTRLGIYPCGCMVTRGGIENPCFSPNCSLINGSMAGNKPITTRINTPPASSPWTYNINQANAPKKPVDMDEAFNNLYLACSNNPRAAVALEMVFNEMVKMRESFLEVTTKWVPPNIHEEAVKEAARKATEEANRREHLTVNIPPTRIY